MAYLANHESNGTQDEPLGDLGNDEYRPAQGFVPSAGYCDSVQLYLRKVNTISDAITVRIETDSSSLPSGTLVDPNATTTITPSNTSYDWVTATFPNSFALSASTTYWIKCTLANQSTNNRYDWIRSAANNYTAGIEAMSYNGGAYNSAGYANYDLYFRVVEGLAPVSSNTNLKFMTTNTRFF